MRDDNHGVIGIGYEGLSVEELTSRIAGWGVTTLVDVRLNAISRKHGFSKKALSAYLADHGVTYRHMPELGNPRENREGYGDSGTKAGQDARALFAARLESPEANDRLTQIVALASNERVAILCFEKHESSCHRHEILNAVRTRLVNLVEA